MRRAVLPVLFVLCATFALAQVRPPFSSVGGFGSVLFPGTGHAPSLPPGGISGRVAIPGQGQFGRPFGNGGYGGGFNRHQSGHGRTAIIPYPVYYGGYYGGYDGQGGYPYPPDNGGPPPIGNPNGAPAVVINQNFIPDHANPLVREYDQPGDPSGQPSSGMRLYQAPPTHPYADAQEQAPAGPAPRRPVYDEQPTLYLIAFQDHSIVQALGYWMEGDTLHYVSAEHSLNQASINLIDRKLS